MTKSVEILYENTEINVTKETNLVLAIANKLRGTYKAEDYQDVIIPMVIIRRFECALEDTKDEVVKTYEANPKIAPKVLERKSGHSFYNVSHFNLSNLQDQADDIKGNFKDYIKGFSANVKTIIEDLDFIKQIDKLDKANKLLLIIKAFANFDLSPKTVDNMRMGYLFEDILRRYSENVNAGDHYTPREVIRCLANLLLAEGCDDIYQDGKIVKIGDFACGTGGMLSTINDFILRKNSSAKIHMYGQEILDSSYAICLADMLIKGQDASHIQQVNTLKEDAFPDDEFRFVIMNPPFGTPWSGDKAANGTKEAVEESDRFKHRVGIDGPEITMTPASGDAQLLFMQHALKKLNKENGRAAIITNGSPLFSGGTGSGESQIRRWMLENDLIEAIIGFPDQLFYNTGISIYAYILSYNKQPKRKGKVQLIDATKFYKKMRKSMGNKRNELSNDHIKKITHLYADFKENDYSKIFDNEEFLYKEYAVYQPMQRNYRIDEERIQAMIDNNTLKNFYDKDKIEEYQLMDPLPTKTKLLLNKFLENESTYEEIIHRLVTKGEEIGEFKEPKEFTKRVKKLFKDLDIPAGVVNSIIKSMSRMDKTADIQKDALGNIIPDKETKDIELVPYKQSIDEYMEKEVLPHVPDAMVFFEEDLSKKTKGKSTPAIKTGAEIPFTRYFYKYQAPESSDELLKEFKDIDLELNKLLEELG
ncbi:SAM-dependent DNA methyltransferase [Enterococcus sp. DIV0242_7C1]|uniref:site-specific DNA-methyltransferase (adenine-specific) n=4 Tax=Candidatus Enterococcus dunnyi TaxID=1834192 RepID=A0AAQ3Y5G8_9ENTE|nr:class I SAM-dependent DNA methyltransferase [Enterococcus sp. DIV0242_7C1]MBO0471034.1 SAM-dependent DNA methyltransferase [Enterococcus sp. DIV0242_7C1]